jgi:hypothetical protein
MLETTSDILRWARRSLLVGRGAGDDDHLSLRSWMLIGAHADSLKVVTATPPGSSESRVPRGRDLLREVVQRQVAQPVSFAARIRSSQRTRRRCRSSRSASCPRRVLVAKAVSRCPSASVMRSCAPGCGRSLPAISRIPVGQPVRSSRHQRNRTAYRGRRTRAAVAAPDPGHARQLKIDTHLHELRHYSATELLTAVAGCGRAPRRTRTGPRRAARLGGPGAVRMTPGAGGGGRQ